MRARRTRGVTLVEILVSIVILSIGLLGGVQCLLAAMQANLKAQRVALATAIAQSVIESQRGSGELVASASALSDEPLLPQGQITVTVADYQPQLRIKKLSVAVSWTGAQTREHIRLDTLVRARVKH